MSRRTLSRVAARPYSMGQLHFAPRKAAMRNLGLVVFSIAILIAAYMFTGLVGTIWCAIGSVSLGLEIKLTATSGVILQN